jgi:signal transduction histidine kinase
LIETPSQRFRPQLCIESLSKNRTLLQRRRALTGQHSGGTSLGLAIVEEAVGPMAGEITLESESGKGNTFTIYLPLQLEQNPKIRL